MTKYEGQLRSLPKGELHPLPKGRPPPITLCSDSIKLVPAGDQGNRRAPTSASSRALDFIRDFGAVARGTPPQATWRKALPPGELSEEDFPLRALPDENPTLRVDTMQPSNLRRRERRELSPPAFSGRSCCHRQRPSGRRKGRGYPEDKGQLPPRYLRVDITSDENQLLQKAFIFTEASAP